MFGVWGASGQVCTCGTRLLVHSDVHDRLVATVVGRIDVALQVGEGAVE